MKQVFLSLEIRGLCVWGLGGLCALWIGGCAQFGVKQKIMPSPSNIKPIAIPKKYEKKFAILETIEPLEKKKSMQPKKKIASVMSKSKNKKKQQTKKAMKQKTKRLIRAKTRIQKKTQIKKSFVFPNRRSAASGSVRIGEQMTFRVTYFGIPAGQFILKVLPLKQLSNQRIVYHFQGWALSSKLFSLFYRVHDRIESYMDYFGIFSHRFELALDETKQKRNHIELYDSEKKETFFWNRWDRKEKGYVEEKKTVPMKPFPQDAISALFYLRLVSWKNNKKLSFPLVMKGKSYKAKVTSTRFEMMQTILGRVPTVVWDLEPHYQGVLQKTGRSLLWLTKDARRIPVRLEAKVKIGSIVATLVDFIPGKVVDPNLLKRFLAGDRSGVDLIVGVPARKK